MTRDRRSAKVEELLQIVAAADRDGPVPLGADKVLAGLSGRKTVGLLQRLAAARAGGDDRCYAEIGVFRGLTLLSVALAAPETACYGIDDFSILDGSGENLGIVRNRITDLRATNARLINADYEAVIAEWPRRGDGRRIAVYFVDGAHDYRSQLMALLLVLPHLTADAAVVIDDANYAFVRRATRDFLLTHREFRLVFEAYGPGHPANLDRETLARGESGWLNGVHVLARDPDGILAEMLPPVADDRTLYVNDWLVHRHGLAELAPEALDLAAAALRGDGGAEASARQRLKERHAAIAPALRDRLPDRNTYSAALTHGHLNALRRRGV